MGIPAIALALARIAAAPLALARDGSIELRTVAEKEVLVVNEKGKETLERVPASLVMPGEDVIYSIRARNVGGEPTDDVVITDPVPANMTYRAGTASGSDARLKFSVDQGQSYDVPENLIVVDEQGRPKRAEAEDYTHIRWELTEPLAPGESRSFEFRARLD